MADESEACGTVRQNRNELISRISGSSLKEKEMQSSKNC